jgi:uridine monophosphate synthetase
MGFFTLLENRVRQVDSLLCVGLDPHPGDLPVYQAGEARDFCLRLIEATSDQVAAYKPNSAFFEAFGSEGMAALQQVIEAVPEGIPVILDAKRGDIASTAQAYAQAAFHTLGADALTVNPYLGYDAVGPFLEAPEKGVFLLCKTSNPGAADLQDLHIVPDSGEGAASMLYEHVARLAQKWNQNDNLGLVVGATQLEALARVRSAAPDLWILAPGVGAQGGDLRLALEAGLRSDGLGMLVPVSRAISRAGNPRQAAQEFRSAINRQRSAVSEHRVPEAGGRFLAALADSLLKAGCVKFGQFTLKSGLISPIYIDLRRLVSDPALLAQVAAAYLPELQELGFERLAALPYAALPIATAISLQGGWPMIYPRKESKDYGTRSEIEGVYEAGERVVLIDDLATTGGSKFEAIEKLTAAGLQVEDIVVLIDRQSGAGEALAQAGFRMHAVFTLTQMLDHWELSGQVPADQITAVRKFLGA